MTDTSRLPANDRAHKSGSTTSNNKSLINVAELRLVEMALTDLLLAWATSSGATELKVMLITPYTAQRNKLNEVVQSVRDSRRLPRRPCADVRVSTVDGCQGASVDCVILSLVRSEPGAPPGGSTDFLSDERRVNVMMSRAQSHLHVIGDMDYLSSSEGVWKSWWDNVRRRWRRPGLPGREHIEIVAPDRV